ncbi:hypothetical protein L218DRAFT_609409 [Marasmius fiardii PR-910]|nr:hypothetical protein L218DRAFT_609409 [Marasmius fiardii PR-910]
MLSRPIASLFTRSRTVTNLRASFYSSPYSKHTTESYNKDVDVTPPDDSKIHRVDPGSENVQKPHEPPSGKWSETGVNAAEQYRHVSKSEPYKAPGEDRRWGGKEEYTKEKGPETSKPGDGPTGGTKEGLKP